MELGPKAELFKSLAVMRMDKWTRHENALGEVEFMFLLETCAVVQPKFESKVLGGPHSTMDKVLALHVAALGSILGAPRNIYLDIAEI